MFTSIQQPFNSSSNSYQMSNQTSVNVIPPPRVSSRLWADDIEDDKSDYPAPLTKNTPLKPLNRSFPRAWTGALPRSINGSTTPSTTSTTPSTTSTTPSTTNTSSSTPDDVSRFITRDIRLADSDGDIRLFHYVDCDNNSSDDVKSCRGIIRRGDNILCKTFGFTPEISASNMSEVLSNIHSFSSCRVYDSEEGATIRLWFDPVQIEWRLSTHRKINAYMSRWGCPNARSFGDMFVDALIWESLNGSLKGKFEWNTKKELLTSFFSSLDKYKNYTFLVRNSHETRIVCEAESHPRAYFIGSFDTDTNLLLEGNDSGFPFPREHKFETVGELLEFVVNLDHRKKQGVIVYLPNQKQVKILNPKYLEFFEARGNEQSIKFRYLQVRKDQRLVSILYTLYNNLIPTFEEYESILIDVAKKIHRSYVSRFIHREFVSLPQGEFFILQACHGWHVQDRIHNKITLSRVCEIMDMQNPTILNRLIKPYLLKTIESIFSRGN